MHQNITTYKCRVPPSQTLKIGLVLGGGGAKGAYQLGVWKALQDYQRAKFEVIAGTSVGALNALLFTSTDYKTAVGIWMKLSGFGKLSKYWLRSACAWLSTIGVFAFPLLLAISSFVTVRVQSHEAQPRFQFVGLLSSTFASYGFLYMVTGWNRLFGSIATVSDGIYLLSVLIAGTGVYPLCIFIFVTHYLEFGPWHVALGVAARIVVGLIVIFLSGKSWAKYDDILIRQYGRAMGTSLLDRKALESLIDQQLDGAGDKLESWKCKNVIVTIAKYATFYDPRQWTTESLYALTPVSTGAMTEKWVPLYVNLRARDPKARRSVFLESAALPFVFPNSLHKSTSYCDGGIVDNLPIAPVLSGPRLDLVIAISLSPSKNTNRTELFKLLDENWRSFLTSSIKYHPNNTSAFAKPMSSAEAHEMQLNKAFEATKPSRYIKDVEIVTIAPSRALATITLPILNFVTGTMNFGETIFELWIKQGYDDARKVLDSIFGAPDEQPFDVLQ